MTKDPRSGCPINLSVELLGDRWSLIVLRDIIFGGKRHFTDLVRRSEEGITPPILTDRLNRLEEAGLLTRRADPDHSQRSILCLTESAIEMVPVLNALSTWGLKNRPVADRFRPRASVIAEGGPELTQELMELLREDHLGQPPSSKPRPHLAKLRTAAPS